MPRTVYPKAPCTAGCGTVVTLYPRKKGTMCKRCTTREMSLSQYHRDACSRAMRRRWRDPAEAAKLRNAISRGCSTPEESARRSEQGRFCCNARAAGHSSESRAKAGRTLSKTRLGWLPAEYRPLYLKLRRNHKKRAAEARVIVENKMREDRLARMGRSDAAFERQLEAVRAGAVKIVPAFAPKKVMPDVTLGGVATGLI